MNRRDFLLLRPDRGRRFMKLSCEQLYMRFVDAELDDSVPALFEELENQLRAVTTLQLTDTAWLARPDMKRALDRLLADFRKRGGIEVRSLK